MGETALPRVPELPIPVPPGRTFPGRVSSGRLLVREPTARKDGPEAWFFQLLQGKKTSWPVNTGLWIPKKTECFVYQWMGNVSVPDLLTLLKLFPPLGMSSLPLSP